MKKTILLFVLLAGFSWKGEAQHFIASFGTQHSWGVPYYVSDVVYNNYYDYDWVHANRILRGGYVSFDLLLQRGNQFVEVRVGHNGRIRSTRFIDHYPLHDHVCGDYCGFHASYYNTYYNTCNSHYHRGHNHVVYRPAFRRRIYHGQGYYYSSPRYSRNYRYRKGYRYNSNRHHNHNNHYNDNHSKRNRNNGRSGAYSKSGDNNRNNNRNSRTNVDSRNKRKASDNQNRQRRDSKSYYSRRN